MSYVRMGETTVPFTAQDVQNATANVQKYGPQIAEAIGPMAASLMPMIANAVKSMGPAAMGFINTLPLPPEVKNFIRGIIDPRVPTPPAPPPPKTVKKGTPTWVWAVGGVGVVTIIAIAASRR